ncbi:MAG: glycosyltransferase family 2 protein [Candidatus Yonathbacteria bacterium]|nr:glycosyltransferase family 2 protein [Candidatus Yonathbacteria bacterium]
MIETFFSSIFYIFLFMTLYLEVFFLVTFLEEREELVKRALWGKLSYYPSATIIVPVWNEEKTVSATVHSLLRLHYPKHKVKVIIVDDGSTDHTWEIIQKFARNSRITLLKKENGGKHTAVNFAIEKADTELVGCLDADSFVDKDALTEIARAFNEDREIMAVTPILIVHEPKTILQKMQKTEYYAGAFLRRMLSPLDGIFVTPGPFSIFRKEVFDKIGIYKRAHNTEDMEFALRMQSHHMRIRNVHTAHVYTTTPGTLYTLYRQRLRWTYGIMKNTLDYRFMLFRREYGLLGMIVLPLSLMGVFIFLYNFGFIAFYASKNIVGKIIEISVVGVYSSLPHFNLFFLNTDFTSLLLYILLGIGIFFIWNGTRITEGKFRLTLSVFYFVILYGIVAPLWLTRATFNVAFARGTKWR